MRKYFTWRCIGLHALTLVLVPAFLVAGWWQYQVARSGNDLSWVYTVEWPFFAVYALYMWWKLIHDRSTPFDRLWAARQRAAADASGRPLHEIPGWATDKELSRAVLASSTEAARLYALAGRPPETLDARDRELVVALTASRSLGSTTAAPWAGSLAALPLPVDRPVESDTPTAPAGVTEGGAIAGEPNAGGTLGGGPTGGGPTGGGPIAGDTLAGPHADQETVIDARVLREEATVDDELEAYNRYLAELAWRDPPKRWGPGGRGGGHAGDDPSTVDPSDPGPGDRP